MEIKPVAYLPKIVGRTEQERRLIDKMHHTLTTLEQAICLAPKGVVLDGVKEAHESTYIAYVCLGEDIASSQRTYVHPNEKGRDKVDGFHNERNADMAARAMDDEALDNQG